MSLPPLTTTHFPWRSLALAALLTFGGLLVVLYLIFQARFLILGPQLTLEPTHPGRHNQREVLLRGTAANITRLWLNDRQIFTDRAGNFEEAVILENGYTIMTLAAEDRYGRRTEIRREFVYHPSTFAH
jgi:hypothetical protein